jgi:translation initiation factor 1
VSIEKETSRQIRVYSKKERFGKWVTVVEGLKGEELKEAVKELKHKLACGGTNKGDKIILQGEHRDKTKQFIIGMGYPQESVVLG